MFRKPKIQSLHIHLTIGSNNFQVVDNSHSNVISIILQKFMNFGMHLTVLYDVIYIIMNESL